MRNVAYEFEVRILYTSIKPDQRLFKVCMRLSRGTLPVWYLNVIQQIIIFYLGICIPAHGWELYGGDSGVTAFKLLDEK